MKNVIEIFYKAFNDLDAETMVSCYHKDIVFEDPAFGVLKGKRAGNMWRMLCESQKGKNFKIVATNITCNSKTGAAHWEAFYTFSKTGRKIHNKIDGEFIIKDGKIIKHTDYFNLHNWAKQALGFKGYLMGGSGFFRRKLHSQTNGLLDKFEGV